MHHQDSIEESWEAWSTEDTENHREGEEEIEMQSIVPKAVDHRKNFQRQGGQSLSGQSPPLVNCTLTSIAETTEEDESHDRMERGQGQDTTTPTHSLIVAAEVHESEVKWRRPGLESQPTTICAGIHNTVEEYDESMTVTYV